MRRWGMVLGLMVLVASLAPASAATHHVKMFQLEYDPRSITIAAGDTVTWTNGENAPHSVSADDGSFESNGACPPLCMGPGATFSHTFAKSGTFPYYCRVHGEKGGQGMSGTVVVQAPPQATTAPTTTARPGAAATTTTARGATTTAASAGATTTTVADTTTSSSSSTTSSTTSTTSTTALAFPDEDDEDDGGNGLPALLLGVAILAFLGAGGYALWRFRPNAPPAG